MNKFGYLIRSSVFALGLAAFGLAPATQALADNNKHRKHYIGHAKNYSYNHHNYKRHYYNRPHYNRHSKWRGHYRYNSHRHGGHGGEVALGLLTGGLIFYALTANQRNNYYDRGYDRKVYVQQQPVYVQPQQQWTGGQAAQPQNSGCLQVREYQTTITVGGQSVPAYGQSCLQQDGSWKLGPAIPEPGY